MFRNPGFRGRFESKRSLLLEGLSAAKSSWKSVTACVTLILESPEWTHAIWWSSWLTEPPVTSKVWT